MRSFRPLVVLLFSLSLGGTQAGAALQERGSRVTPMRDFTMAGLPK